ncbi:MAG: DUF6298 domain-containing protein [Dysgonamonadaceae bacterium]|jgi:hypothetical protein|nr:DUF6298 domain-containing protein [Dysgonamonadaceae bacterium]
MKKVLCNLLFICWVAQNTMSQIAPDSQGNRIPDFSYAGYMAGEKKIPDVPVKIVVPTTADDAGLSIQAALDYVSSLPLNSDGFRGAVLLMPGEYKVAGSLYIRASGVVLRGSGMGESGTKLIAAGKDRRNLLRIMGVNDKKVSTDTLTVADDLVPVNAMSFAIAGTNSLKPGDKIIIRRPSTAEWIKELSSGHFGGGLTSLGWKPNGYDILWDRTVVSVEEAKVTIDAPITTALEKQYGGGFVIPYTWDGRIANVGVENLSFISEYDTENKKDEAHSWLAVSIENASDAWVRYAVFKHFAGSAVHIAETAKRITVENCKSLEPVSEIGGQRRNTFFTMGQQCLFLRIHSEYGYHDFSLGFCAPGPNAFVQCYAYLPYSFSGPVYSWASGVLFDVVTIDGNALSYKNRGKEDGGAGWNAANSVFWQCSASRIDCFAPPTAQNWAVGSWSEFSGNGHWEQSNTHVKPYSLFFAQLKNRLGDKMEIIPNLLTIETEASTSPTLEQAAALTKLAVNPTPVLFDWIDRLVSENPISILSEGAKILDISKIKAVATRQKKESLAIKNGWLVRGNRIQTGGRIGIRWWSGTILPAYLKREATPHLTRFVPGRTGTGLTDAIDDVTGWMLQRNVLCLDHNYGLWYDRRRDDHERIRRMDGNVWPPFYEQPFARSGQGTAYDGLSKYDLTKYNDWYWMRLKQFADQADQKGLVLLHQNYFQHNIIEAGAHWTDSPWRPTNNINNTGFPEPAPYAGDKRIFLAEQFYDIHHPVRKVLHRAYIRQCLDSFKDKGSVIQLISEEFTGPLHFVEFWLDVIAEWEQETGKHPLIALSTTKDVQDAILSDPVRSKVVDIIDIRYWLYRENGTVYEPKGGQNLAPRQHARQTNPGRTSFESVYRAVSEYRTNYPEKAVTYYSDAYPQFAWAVFMASGSFAGLPAIKDGKFLESASGMSIGSNLNIPGQYVLSGENGYIVYTTNKDIDLKSFPGKHTVYWVNTETGAISKDKPQSRRSSVAWLVKN